MNEIMSNPTDWSQIYRQNSYGQATTNPNSNYISNLNSDRTLSGSMFGEANTVTTTTIETATKPNTNYPNPEGRTMKPIRRRSRASKRTPTTLINTDATNFRAMVQQFTGGPSLNAPSFTFGLEQPLHGLVYPPHMVQQQQPSYLFSLGDTSNINTSSQGGMVLERSLGLNPSSRLSSDHRFYVEGHSGNSTHVVVPNNASATTTRPPPTSSSSANGNSGFTFFSD